MQAGCELQQTFQCFKDDHHAKFTDSGVIFYSIYYCLLAQTNGTAFALAEGWAFIALEWMRDTWAMNKFVQRCEIRTDFPRNLQREWRRQISLDDPLWHYSS